MSINPLFQRLYSPTYNSKSQFSFRKLYCTRCIVQQFIYWYNLSLVNINLLIQKLLYLRLGQIQMVDVSRETLVLEEAVHLYHKEHLLPQTIDYLLLFFLHQNSILGFSCHILVVREEPYVDQMKLWFKRWHVHNHLNYPIKGKSWTLF